MTNADRNRYLAEMGYSAYGKSVDWKAFNGQPMPQFDELPPRIQRAWTVAAAAIRRRVVVHGFTLGDEDYKKEGTGNEV